MAAKATETHGRLMIYVKAYFNGVHFLVHYVSVNIKNFLCFTSSEAEIAKSVSGWATGWALRVSIPGRGQGYFYLPKVQNISGASQTSIQWASGFFPPESSGGVGKLSIHVCLVPIHAFMLWTGTILRLSCTSSWHVVW
jgi:hypothetical protein